MLQMFRRFWQKIGLLSLAFVITQVSFADSATTNTTSTLDPTNIFAHVAPPTTSVADQTKNLQAQMQTLNPTQPALNKTNTAINTLNPTPPALTTNGYYLQDVYSGKVLATQNPDQRMQIASLTKLMTLYIIFEALQAGRIHLDDPVLISKDAWQTGGSRMFVQVGDQIPVSTLINGIIIDSGNDACVAMAEHVAGTQDSFVSLMNQQAQLLGMNNTHYMDCTGLPNPDHYSSPHDLAILVRSMILNFPEYYPLFKQKQFTFNNITQQNRNKLLWADPSVDGLKTGFTDQAGYCLVASALRNDMRLLSVVLGAPSPTAREQYSESLLNYGYQFFETHKTYDAYAPIEQARVWFSSHPKLSIGTNKDIYITVPNGQYQNVNIQTQLNLPLKAPIMKNQKVGTITATLNGKAIATEDLVALQNAPTGGLFTRMIDHFKLAMTKQA